MSPFLTQDEIFTCCACQSYASALATTMQVIDSVDQVIEASRRLWWNETPVTGWLEAFGAHPKIGDFLTTSKSNANSNSKAFEKMSRNEQGDAVTSASEHTLQSLAEWNEKYEKKFGHIFIIYAPGKPASLMLKALQLR